jgi:hypothetical protein
MITYLYLFPEVTKRFRGIYMYKKVEFIVEDHDDLLARMATRMVDVWTNE